MKALVFDGSLRFVRDAALPTRADEALVQVICAGICNTDLEIAKGYAGFNGILGHEFVGRVIESPDSLQVGQRVVGEINAGCGLCRLCLAGDSRHCVLRTTLGIKARDGAFAEFLSLPARNLITIPDSLSNNAAVFVEPLAAALNILEQVKIDPSTRVAVIGDGKLAQLTIIAVAQTGCDLTVIGKHEKKLALAKQAARLCLRVEDASAQSAIERWIRNSKLEGEFDVVIEASGSKTGLPMALKLARPQGVVALKSTYHEPAALDLSSVVVNEITILGSRCGRFRPAIDLLSAGAININPLITSEFPFEDCLLAFQKAAEPESLKVVLNIS
jgi:threonine dehydrogenase-like Zn-dependent dehydrogenase